MKVQYFKFKSVNSTNDIAAEKINGINEINSPIVVTSQIQTKGRGRNNKIWFDGSNNLYYSFAIKHNINTIPIHFMQVIGGIAAYNTISTIIDKNIIRLKYPNDIYIFNDCYKKIAGIISEHFFSYNDICSSIIGIGINNKQSVFPDNLNAISLYNLGKNIENDYLTERLTNNISALINTDIAAILDNWKNKLNLHNKNIKVIDNKTKKILAANFRLDTILDDCRLLVADTDNNKRIIDNGDSIIYDLE